MMNRLKKNAEGFTRFGTFYTARACFFLFALFYTNCFFVQAQGQTQTQKPHPAVVRVIAGDVHKQDRISLGSGTLIAKKTNYGFVITNWHVVRDSNGYVNVWFPDGRTCEAAVVAVDDRWDLALLIISEPKGVEPVVISPTIPKIGETYWVAGYRRDGTYRIQGGYCIKFQAPEEYRIEPELIEIGVPSESGDSGGPIFNAKSELAGVLFGSTETTMGTHCGRVFKFLEQAAPNVTRLPATPEPVVKAASLSRQSILQRGEIAFGSSSATQTTRPVTVQPDNTYVSAVSSSMSFGGSSVRARGNSQETPSQTWTRRQRHGFLNIEYDLSVANTLLAAEKRNGTSPQSNTSASGNFSLNENANQSSPASASSGNSARTIQPINRTGTQNTQGGMTASAAMTDPVTARNAPAPATTPPAGTAQTPMTSGWGNLTAYPQSTGANTTPAAAETLPVSASQMTQPQMAGASPAYGGNAHDGIANHFSNTNIGGAFNDRSGGPVSGTAEKPATGTLATPTRRETGTTPGGTRDATGNTSNSTSSGGRSAPSSTGFTTYGQNSATPQPASPSPSRGSSLTPSDDFVSEYALKFSDMQMDDDYAPKYADDFVPGSTGADVTGATSKYDAIKIVIAILVIFFILFHTIKTMAVAEERQ